jgi:FlaA1/EpsC-like NDP-sugar epimerase
VSLGELRQLASGIAVGSALTAAAVLMLRYEAFPRSVLVLFPLLSGLFIAASRAVWRTISELQDRPKGAGRPLVVIGSHTHVAQVLRSMQASKTWQPVAIVSPDARDMGSSIQSVRVLGLPEDLAQVVESTEAVAVLVASPAGSAERRNVLLHAAQARVPWLTLPRADDWLRSEGSVSAPRKVEIEDLLGRSPVQLDVGALAELFSGQAVLVTGAGGSIGSELCRQICRLGVSKLACVDVSEYAMYTLEQELRAAHPQLAVNYYTGNVREYERLLAIAQAHMPAVVFHAAAYKHVPLMETLNEVEALRTNVLGTYHAAQVAGAVGAKRFVLISTDKAVNPTNVMGASKRVAEQMVQAVAQEFANTQFVSVRFGNVLGSSGSVVPLFEKQIAAGGPVTVTHPDIVRYFMTIPEACRLVLQAGLMGQSGQIFVLDMGEPVKIVELARMMIRLSGKTEEDIAIQFSGLRPGEKLFEELLADGESTEPTPHPKLRIAKVLPNSRFDAANVREWIDTCGPTPNAAALRTQLLQWVPEYKAQAQ